MNLLNSNLKNFFFGIYTCQINFNKKVNFDERFFFALRGAIGYKLKKVTCVTKSFDCKKCLLKFNCPYKYIFETEPPPDTNVLKKYDSIPHPFLFNNFYKKTEKIILFDLVLVGKAIDYLPFLVYVIDSIGKDSGLGKERIKFKLSKIYSYRKIKDFLKNKCILIYRNEKLLTQIPILKIEEIKDFIPETVEKISIEFITPTRIKYKNKLVSLPEFHIIVRSLIHRLSALMYFHCGKNLDIDFKTIIEKSKSIELINHNIKWKDYKRFSTRQKKEIKLGGVVGKAEYKGEISSFLPLLYIGKFVNIGKQTSFGLGWYNLEYSS